MKTKIAFNDIPNVIERDEMRNFLGGQGKIESASDTTPGPDELTPKGLVFGTPGVISAPLPGYPTPTYQGGQLNTVVITPRKNYTYGGYQFGSNTNSVFNNGSSSGYNGIGGGFDAGNSTGTRVGNGKSGLDDSDSTSNILGAFQFGWETKTILTAQAFEYAAEISINDAKYIGYLKAVGDVSIGASAFLTFKDAYKKGELSDYHVADLGTTALIYGISSSVPVAGWTLGAAYFFANYYCEKTYGEGLYEHLSGNKK